MRLDDAANFLVGEVFEDAVACDYDEFIAAAEVKTGDFRIWRDSNSVGYHVSDRSAHCKPWHIGITQPDSTWSQTLALAPFERLDSPTTFQNSLHLTWQVWFVVRAHRCSLPIRPFTLAGKEHSPRVSYIRTEYDIPIEHQTATRRSAELCLKLRLQLQLLVYLLIALLHNRWHLLVQPPDLGSV